MSAPLDAYLASRSDRCPGCQFHVATQGCACAGRAEKSRGQAIATSASLDDAGRVDAAIRLLAATGREFSSNEARGLHGVTGPVVGARFTAARKAGLIRSVGFTESTAESTHAHPVRLWVGTAA